MKTTLVNKFKNYSSTNPETISLWDWLNDDSYKKDVEYIRTIEDKKMRTELKSKLPCITPSGTFSKRKSDCLIKHSGFICIDIDGADNQDIKDFKELRQQLKNILNITYASLSVSGNGVFCLIPIMYPEKHKEHFEALKKCFEMTGIIIDKGCGDVARLRGYSYDEDAYFNQDAIVFNQLLDLKSEKKDIIPKVSIDNINYSNNTHNKVMKIIEKINSSGVDITGDYKQWFDIGCALANEFNEEGREMFQQISQNSPKYSQHVCDNTFSSILSGNYSFTIGTFFHYAQEEGVI